MMDTYRSIYQAVKDQVKAGNRDVAMTHNWGFDYDLEDFVMIESWPGGTDFYSMSVTAKLYRAHAHGREIQINPHRANNYVDYVNAPLPTIAWETAVAVSHNVALMWADQAKLDGTIDPMAVRSGKEAFRVADQLIPKVRGTVPYAEVAILASEDNPRTTTVPRLKAAAADVSKVRLIQGTSDGNQEWEIALDTDLDRMRAFLADHPVIKLVVMDPVTSYIGEVDPNKPKEVRPFLNRLKKFAEEMGVSLLLIMHLSKNPDVSALHRVGGAATWIEVPRSVWFFDLKQQEEESDAPPSYVMVNGKLNIVADGRKKSLEYNFAGVDVEIKGVQQSMGTIRWGEESSITLEQQYGGGKHKPGPSPIRTAKVIEWLKTFLSDGGRLQEDIVEAGAAEGYSKRSLDRVKNELEIVSYREPAGRGKWWWRLPENHL